ncbi:MAG: cupin domain-containing protein [Acidobacteriia bacterium]|nr:cupin domain-containing protein [Terriglobia bacterium]
MHSIEQIIEHFRLKPLPWEGGYYNETYRSAESIPAGALQGKYPGARSISTVWPLALSHERGRRNSVAANDRTRPG